VVFTPAERSEVWLGLVGRFAVRRGDIEFTSAKVGSRKARTVLALLAVERSRIVSPWTIVDVLWHGAPPRRPVGNVATLVSRVRAVLGPDVVNGDRSGYRLGEAVRTDIHDAAQLVAAAEGDLSAREPKRARAAAERALKLLGSDPVLADHPGAAWTQPAQTLHVELLRRARHAAAQAALSAGDFRAAAAAAEVAVRADPLDEVAYRTLLTAYNSAGEPARALIAFERLRQTLARELGVDPAPATRELHVSILQGGRE
jgi:DNA-binding SARP family transcriptional activator